MPATGAAKSLIDIANFANLLKIEVTPDGLAAFVPAGTVVSPKVLEWPLADLQAALRRFGYAVELKAADLAALHEHIKRNPDGLDDDVVLLRGTPVTPPKPPTIEWLNKSPIPHDMAIKGRPFMVVHPPEPAQPGLSVFGTPVAPSADDPVPEPKQLQVGEGITLNDDGTLVAAASGQILFDDPRVSWRPTYEIADSSLPQYREAEFFCSVHVKGDLVGTVRWKVWGAFHVEGHLSASNIEVHGDMQVDSGIQSGNDGVVKAYGNLRTTYIQFSRVGVAKELMVDSSIVQSEVRVGGSILCRGDPGVIMGSEVSCFGAIIANKVGSDKGRRTRIQIHRRSPHLKPPKTKIGMLSKDTRMRVFGEIWTQREDATYESPDLI